MKQGKTLLILLVLLVACLGVYLALRSYNQAQEEVDDTVYLTNLGEVTSLSFTGTDGSDLSFTKDGDQWSWNGDADFPTDQDALTALAEDLAALPAVRTFDEPDSLDAYGLDTPSLLHLLQRRRPECHPSAGLRRGQQLLCHGGGREHRGHCVLHSGRPAPGIPHGFGRAGKHPRCQ